MRFLDDIQANKRRTDEVIDLLKTQDKLFKQIRELKNYISSLEENVINVNNKIDTLTEKVSNPVYIQTTTKINEVMTKEKEEIKKSNSNMFIPDVDVSDLSTNFKSETGQTKDININDSLDVFKILEKREK